ncbi:hypothetical protein [Sorangium sp. So ce887]|uniref:hypothetical protein n=1 Tax=Sorangium sp. So ce887 TaxID=3133324 RepID=UPI003F642C1C
MARVAQRGTANAPTHARAYEGVRLRLRRTTRREADEISRRIRTHQVESDAASGIGNHETGDARCLRPKL